MIVVDCSDLQRAGSTGGTHVLNGRVPDLNIDHHITNLKYAKTNLVVAEQVATSAILAEYLPEWGLSYNKAIAARTAHRHRHRYDRLPHFEHDP